MQHLAMPGNSLAAPKIYVDRETGETHPTLMRRVSSTLRRSFRQVTGAFKRPLNRNRPQSSYRSLTNEDVPEVKPEETPQQKRERSKSCH
ncbi:hypothetical protein PRIPAC_97635 [Pristionchus pacificus]|uniref:Uncharacterized protein n=1 Tax=Pristionchus pacificus TaxID=54126 RepID=A0A8R1US07_PRIPA|nr:hypothetical protein PRIPAC_97635 [Pristionchus pacificus]|eukprot:PDM66174.1 hypothetical protein PRIPAC_45399 [Pristionchus pacificus]